MGLGKFSLREASSRPTRAVLTFSSITIGVAAVVAVLLATSTTRRAQQEMLKALSGDAQLEVVSDGSSGFSYAILQDLRELAGVETAAPSITRNGVVFVGEAKARTQVLGVDPRIDQQVRAYELVDGRNPEKLSEVMLDSSFANSLAAQVGDEIRILARSGIVKYELVGLVRPNGAEGVALGSAVYMVLPSAQRAFKVGNVVDQILIKATADTPVEELQASIAEVLPVGVSVRVPRTRSAMASEAMFSTENGLLMAIAFALLIALFIIYNTFQMAVGERRRQLGILRAIGATGKQVGRMILVEAFWLSIAGTLAGSLLGVWGAGFATFAFGQLLQVDLPRVVLSWPPFVIAGLFGIGVSLLGAYLPAKRASTVSPIEAMRSVELKANDAVIRRATPLGFIAIPAGFLLLLCSIMRWLPIGGDIVAVVLMLLGYVLLIPLLLQSTSDFIMRGLSRFIGIEAVLAKKQLMRHVGRSTLTIGVLFIAISTTTGLAGNILDNVQNVRQWYEKSFAGDFFIRASMPDLATGSAANLPDDVGQRLSQAEGIARLDTLRLVSTTSEDSDVLLVIGSHSPDFESGLDLVSGTYRSAVEGMEAGGAIIGSVIAERRKLVLGDNIKFDSEAGLQELKIVGIANDYVGGGLTIHLSPKFAAEQLGVTGVTAYIVRAEEGKLDAVEKELAQYCQENGLIFQSYAEMVRFIDNLINGVIASLWMLLGLGCFIAFIGLVNTLTMNILEQTREIGMLRVVAMTRQQVRRMIFSQALLLGLLGLVPGSIAGIFVAYAIGLSSQAVLGHAVIFQTRPGLVASCFVLGMVIVMLASLIPAQRAARLKLADALQYE